ncbi:hypothetical protein [Microvirga flavescens]|uniref:hypothetical protein n=1 Tax=Microvirga flavescens TaxID=2249811 RepID=UPI000DD5E034|nr:hypothetical protein [Microvirga flavescens]
MKRQITGIIAASAAAPYLGTLSLLIHGVFDSSHSPHSLHAEDFIESFVLVLSFGTLGLLIYGLPLLLAFSIAALILDVLKAEKPSLPICLGSLIGLCFGAFLMASSIQDEWPLLLVCLVSGTICGGIYWLIAYGGSPKAPVT